LASFTRTIPGYKGENHVIGILSRTDHFIPLAYRPARARAGDFIYLIFHGKIVGRARIASIDFVNSEMHREDDRYPVWAKWVIRYSGEWEKPPREIPVQGHQSVRYLDTHVLEHLDSERW
jgi:hypothetical protein